MDIPSPTSTLGQGLRLSQITFAPPERLLYSLSIRDIGHRSYEFKVTRFMIGRWMTDNSNVLDRAIGHQQPMFNIKRLPFARYLIEHSLDEGSVFRMSSVQYEFHGGFVDAFEFENSKRFVGPYDVPIRIAPSGMTRSLRFR